jgi:hypothetical protein
VIDIKPLIAAQSKPRPPRKSARKLPFVSEEEPRPVASENSDEATEILSPKEEAEEAAQKRGAEIGSVSSAEEIEEGEENEPENSRIAAKIVSPVTTGSPHSKKRNRASTSNNNNSNPGSASKQRKLHNTVENNRQLPEFFAPNLSSPTTNGKLTHTYSKNNTAKPTNSKHHSNNNSNSMRIDELFRPLSTVGWQKLSTNNHNHHHNHKHHNNNNSNSYSEESMQSADHQSGCEID